MPTICFRERYFLCRPRIFIIETAFKRLSGTKRKLASHWQKYAKLSTNKILHCMIKSNWFTKPYTPYQGQFAYKVWLLWMFKDKLCLFLQTEQFCCDLCRIFWSLSCCTKLNFSLCLILILSIPVPLSQRALLSLTCCIQISISKCVSYLKTVPHFEVHELSLSTLLMHSLGCLNLSWESGEP